VLGIVAGRANSQKQEKRGRQTGDEVDPALVVAAGRRVGFQRLFGDVEAFYFEHR
jgi:hypothetical protein